MKAQKSIIKELIASSKQYDKLIKKLDTETLKQIATDYIKVLELVKKALSETNPKGLTDDQIHGFAEEFQSVARMELKARGIELKSLN